MDDFKIIGTNACGIVSGRFDNQYFSDDYVDSGTDAYIYTKVPGNFFNDNIVWFLVVNES